MKIMSTKDHGIPHSRPSLYIVGVLSEYEVKRFKFPKALGDRPALKRFLSNSKGNLRSRLKPGSVIRKNIDHFITTRGATIMKKWFVIDAHAGKTFRNMMEGVMPCITRARGGVGGHYVTKLDRFLTVHEMGALQGLPSQAVTKMLHVLGSDDATLGKALGDAMSINVLMRIFSKVLFSSGLVAKPLPDHWATVSALVGSGRDLKLPDALYASIRTPP